MKISIIIFTYNSSPTIETTLKNVSSQTHPVHEHIVLHISKNKWEIIKNE